jgi:hypothetical protein
VSARLLHSTLGHCFSQGLPQDVVIAAAVVDLQIEVQVGEVVVKEDGAITEAVVTMEVAVEVEVVEVMNRSNTEGTSTNVGL